jgi:hypothetical protein
MKKNLGDKAYVFTSRGLVKGVVVKERIDKNTGLPQYKLDIDIDKNNKNKDYNFWYHAGEMYKTKFTAILFELIRPLRVKLFN